MLSVEEEPSSSSKYTYDELAALTKAELIVIAEEKGLTDLSMSDLKETIINAILNSEAE